MKIQSIDHIVLTVRDVEATVNFYERVMGMKAVSFGDNRRALCFGNQRLNLHPARAPFKPHAANPTPGSADICFVSLSSMAQVMEHLEKNGIAIEEGPVSRIGALGLMKSIYFRDPDSNLIEVACYE